MGGCVGWMHLVGVWIDGERAEANEAARISYVLSDALDAFSPLSVSWCVTRPELDFPDETLIVGETPTSFG